MPTAVLEQTHLLKLRADRRRYCRENLKIRTKPGPEGSQLIPLALNRAQEIVDAQVEAQKAATGRIRAIVLKARQEGISTYVAARIYHGCTLWPRRRGLVIADDLDRAGEIFNIYERFDSHAALKPPKRSTRKSRELSWATDSSITVETARDVDTGRATTPDYVHASEFAAWPHPEDTLAGLLDAMPLEAGEFWIESTAKGVGNAFHQMWLDAVAGESDWLAIFLPWFVDPTYQVALSEVEREALLATADTFELAALGPGISYEGETVRLSPEQLAWRRRKIRERGDARVFRQENPATPEEAFLVTGEKFFDAEALIDHGSRTIPPIARGSFIDLKGGGLTFRPDERGPVRIWESPDPDGHYVIGADTSEGILATGRSLSQGSSERGGRDFSSADVLKVSELVDDPTGKKVRIPCRRQVGLIHGRLVPERFAKQIFAAAAYWSCPGRPDAPGSRSLALTGVERNHSSGQTVIRELLERHRHSNMFIHSRLNTRTGKASADYGWVTDGTTRMPMLDEFAAAARDGEVAIRSADTIREMETFVWPETGKTNLPQAEEGCHDDRVISFGIGLQMARHHTDGPAGTAALPPPPVVKDTPTGM